MGDLDDVTDAVGRWARWSLAAGRAAGTVYVQTRYVHRASRAVDLWAASGDELLDWLGSHGWGPETRRSARAALCSFYAWCVGHRLLAQDPMLDVPTVRVPPPCPRPTPDVALARARLAATQPERLMVDLAALGGLRRSEIAAVRRDDLDGDLLRVTGKGGRTRVVPLPADLVARLLASPSGWVFPGRAGRGHICPDRVGRTLSRLLGPGLTGHSLRHRYATRAYAGTRDILALQELLGHASPETTKRYVRVSVDALRTTAAAGSS